MGVIIGGSPQLQHRCIAATSFANLPAVAAENTVGVITTTAITQGFVTNDRPAGRPTGEVRIKPGADGLITMQVLSQPLVEFRPISVYQYNGSAWVLMEAYLRKNAAWVRIRTYFYRDGTLGLITSLSGMNSSAATYQITSTVFRVDVTSGGTTGFARVAPDQLVEVTNFSTLKFLYARVKSGTQGSHTARMALAVSQLTGQGTGAAYVDVGTTAGALASLDVSALTGSYYMNWMISKSSYYETDYILVTEVWGE